MPSTETSRIDGLTTSIAVKAPCIAATTGPITIAGEQTIGGVAVKQNQRVLVKDQADARENGIYLCSTTSWTRAKDFDGSRDAATGSLVVVASSSGASPMYQLTTTDNPIVFGKSLITFVLSTSSGGLVSSVGGAAPIVSSGGLTPTISINTFGASGGSHNKGAVPDPGAVAGVTKFLREDATWQPTVSTVSVVTANGVSGTVANPTTAPAISLSLGAITPTSVAATGSITGLQGTFTQTADAPTVKIYASQASFLSSNQAVLQITTVNGTPNPTASYAASATYNGTSVFSIRNDGLFNSVNVAPLYANFLALGGHNDNATDNTAAFNAAITYCVTNNIPTLYFPAGYYRFASKPADITAQINLMGDGLRKTVLYRNYTAGSATEPFINFTSTGGSGFGPQRLTIMAGTGTTLGSGLQCKNQAGQSGPGFMYIYEVEVTIDAGGAWGTYTVALDGSANTGAANGLRDIHIDGLQVFGDVLMTSLVNAGITRLYCANLVINGTPTNLCTDINISAYALNSINISNAYHTAIHTAYLNGAAGAIVLAATAVSVSIISATAIVPASITNASGSAVILSAGALICGIIKPPAFTVATLPAPGPGFMAYVTDALGPAYGAAVVGGGAVVIPVFDNGVAWVCA